MKKLLAILLVLALTLGVLVACKKDNQDDTTVYDIDGAAAYVEGLYKDDLSITAVDYQVVAQVMVGGVVYKIDWSVDTDKVTVSEPANNTVTIGVDELSAEEVAYKLTATVKAGNGTTKTVTFNLTVPKYSVNSHAEYMAAETGDVLTVSGVVVAINSVKADNKYNHLFLADTEVTGGYYCYKLSQDPTDLGIEVGMTVSVTGTMSPYNGMQEIFGGQAVIIDSSIKTVETLDITDKFAASEDLGAYVGLPVTIKGVELGVQALEKDTDQYLWFSLGEASGYVRTYVTDFPAGMVAASDKTTIDEDHAAHFGWKADVTGILVLYSGQPYLIPMSVTPFTNYEEVIKTPAEKVEAEKEALSVPANVTEDTTLELALVGKYYDDVTISWAIDNENYTIDADGKLAIVLGDEKVTLTLTATIVCGEGEDAVTDTKVLTVTVDSVSTDLYVSEVVETPVANGEYVMVLNQNSLGEVFYFAGYMDGYYLATTEKADKAVTVYVEAVDGVDGAYRLYFMNGETKTYIEVYERQAGEAGKGKGSVQLVTETPANYYTYDATAKTFIHTSADGLNSYYLGTYGTYSTFSVSNASYISGDNASKVDDTQFPARMATLVPATYAPEVVETPEANGEYVMVLNQNSLGKVFYFAGYMDGYYLATTEKADKAVTVYVEAVDGVDGAYRLYFMDGETKTYIEVYERQAGEAGKGKGSVQLVTETPANYYTYDATAKTFIHTSADGLNSYYLGTYGTYSTFSVSNASYISGDNASKVDDTQFPARMATLKAVKVGPVIADTPAADTSYKLNLYQATLGKSFYFAGYMDGYYLATTEKLSKAVDVFVEAVDGVDGAYRLYFMDGETKTYIEVYERQAGEAGKGKGSVQLVTETPANYYTYDATAKTFIHTSADGLNSYYLGTYGTYSTFSVSNASYISGDNASKVDVSQFPARIVTIEIVEDEVHEHVYGEATCTEPATCECGATQGEALGHSISENVCANCGAKVVTVTEAAELEDGTLVIIEATVSAITYAWSDTNGNMSVDITDGTTTINCYKLASKVGVGDVIVITGKVGSYNSVKQIAAGSTAEVKTAHVCSEYTEATCTAAAECVVCGAENGEALGHDYVDGVCSVCNATEPVAGENVTVSTTIASYATANSWANSTLYSEVVLDENITVSVSGTPVGDYGQNTGKYYSSGDGTWRIYQNESPSVTVTAAEGKTIVSVKITYAVKNTGTLTLDGEAVASDTVVEVNANSVTFSVGNTGTATNGNVQITSIEVIYA